MKNENICTIVTLATHSLGWYLCIIMQCTKCRLCCSRRQL